MQVPRKRSADAQGAGLGVLEERRAKVARRSFPLPELPVDLLPRIFGHLGVRGISTIRQVCRLWRDAVDNNSAQLWKSRCYSLRLLPPHGNSPLARAGRAVLKKEEAICQRLSKPRLRGCARMKLYTMQVSLVRDFYYKWKSHVCVVCLRVNPSHTLGDSRMCAECGVLGLFEWVHSSDAVRCLGVSDSFAATNARSIATSHGRLYRVDKLLPYSIFKHSKEVFESAVRKLKRRNRVFGMDKSKFYDI